MPPSPKSTGRAASAAATSAGARSSARRPAPGRESCWLRPAGFSGLVSDRLPDGVNMTNYRAPVADIAHALKSIAGLAAGIDEDLVDAVLEEAGKFASEEIAPLRLAGDRTGARLVDGAVVTPDGWKQLYHRWIEGGWNGIAAPEAWGGQELPQALAVATLEMWNSGSMGFAI